MRAPAAPPAAEILGAKQGLDHGGEERPLRPVGQPGEFGIAAAAGGQAQPIGQPARDGIGMEGDPAVARRRQPAMAGPEPGGNGFCCRGGRVLCGFGLFEIGKDLLRSGRAGERLLREGRPGRGCSGMSGRLSCGGRGAPDAGRAMAAPDAERPGLAGSVGHFGRGAASCRCEMIDNDTLRRPVQRFLHATAVSLEGVCPACAPFIRAPPWPKPPRDGTIAGPSGSGPRERSPFRHLARRTSGPAKPTVHPPRACRTGTSGARMETMTQEPVRRPRTTPPVTGGRPFSAHPRDEDLRLSPTPGAGPASPERLPVYPMDGTGRV